MESRRAWRSPRFAAARSGALVTLLLACLSAGAQTPSYGPADLDTAFERDSLVIHASKNACYRFDIWLALARPQQMRGLMFVRDLPTFSGMLFVYSQPGGRSMWMKNTLISLDILFIREDGRIATCWSWAGVSPTNSALRRATVLTGPAWRSPDPIAGSTTRPRSTPPGNPRCPA